MKKSFIVLLSALFVFSLAGCSGMPTGPHDSQALVDKARNVQKKINSYAVTTTTTMDVSSADKENKTTATTVVRVQKDPYKVHMTRKVVSDQDPSKAQMMDVYMTKNAVYMKSPQGQTQWKKVSSKPSKELESMIEASSGELKLELKKLDQYTNSLAISENDNNYVTSFTGKGKEFKDFAGELAQSQLPQSEELTKYLNNIVENHINYYYSFNNETYYPNEMELIMNMTVKNTNQVSGNINVAFHTKAKFSEFNKVKLSMPGMKKGDMSDMMK